MTFKDLILRLIREGNMVNKFLSKNYAFRTVKIIYNSSKKNFYSATLLLIAFSFIAPIQLIITKHLIDSLTNLNTINIEFIRMMVLFGVVLILANSKYLINIIGSYLWISSEIALQKAIIDKVKKLPLVNYEYAEFYDKIQRAKVGYNNAIGSTMMLISAVCITITSTVGIVIYISYIDIRSLWVISVLAIIKVFSFKIISKNTDEFRKISAVDYRYGNL